MGVSVQGKDEISEKYEAISQRMEYISSLGPPAKVESWKVADPGGFAKELVDGRFYLRSTVPPSRGVAVVHR